MYKGVPVGGIEFYQLLFESDEFCAELGKVVLVAGKLETELVIFFERKGLGENTRKATLGRLIQIANKKQVLDKNLVSALETVCTQRNYLTHNIYSLFLGAIEETILERSNLLDSDVHTFIERAWVLKNNLVELSKIVNESK